MSALTEAEIREAVKAATDASGMDYFDEIVYDLTRPLACITPGEIRGHAFDSTPHLWDDLRPAEAIRLRELHDGIYAQAEAWQAEIEAKITEAVVQAALTFAAEFPDAPRAQREAVTA